MKPFGMILACLVAAAAAVRAGSPTIDHRFGPPRADVPLAILGGGHQAVATPDGGLRYADGARLAVDVTGDLALPRRARGVQTLRSNWLPIVTTTRQSPKLAVESTAFVALSPRMDCLRVVVGNRTGEALAPVLRVQATQVTGLVPAPHTGFARAGSVFALCELRQGSGEVVAAPKPKRSVFKQQGGRALPAWGKPKVPCDRGFRNIVAGFEEPATFLLRADPAARYIVAVGLCESHWRTSGNRICDILVEGKKVATVDPVKKPHRTDVPFVLTFPAVDRNKDGWIAVTSVAARGSPDVNSIVNVIWLFEEAVGKGLKPAEIVSGRATELASCYVDCGGSGAKAGGPVTVAYRIELPPRGSATLWLKRPHGAVPMAQAAALGKVDPAPLLDAAEKAWRKALQGPMAIRLGDPAANDLVLASRVLLGALSSQGATGLRVAPAPFAPAGSARVAARAAMALDRLGAHADAAAILADLASRRAADRAWHDGTDAWAATGQALCALAAHHDLTGDPAWLKANYPAMRSAAEALLDARDLTCWVARNPQAGFYGLMPAAPMGASPHDHWHVHALWACHGIGAAARAARALERPNDYLWLEDNLGEFIAGVRASLARSRVLGAAAGCMPAVPGESVLWTPATCVVALQPSPLVPSDDKALAATLAYIQSHGAEHLPWAAGQDAGAVDVALACDYARGLVARGDAERALAAFTALANASSPTAAFPEQVDPARKRVAGLCPSAEAASAFLTLVREMVACERGDELHILPCVPREWLREGFAVKKLPTAFGPLTCRAAPSADGKEVTIELSLAERRKPKAVFVHPPLPARGTKPTRLSQWTAAKVRFTLK